jgi:asparagine synthase (glutamine-hydrolysing)
MCGIFFYKGQRFSNETLFQFLLENKHRGPDNSKYVGVDDMFFGFNRLRINGLNELGDQPFDLKGCRLICNGEIYNFRDLIKKYGFEGDYHSGSDCEIIIHLYKKLGMESMLKELDGVFAFVLYDGESDELYVARDPLGIRSLYWCEGLEGGELGLASEMKSLVEIGRCSQFPSGHYWQKGVGLVTYYSFDYVIDEEIGEEEVLSRMRELFESGVEKRLMSERKVACLLSGGLDSTLVTSIVCRKIGAENLNTYSIGLKGSVDLKYARMAADYFGTNHTNIELSEEEFLGAIDKTIKQIESWDTTSVRASVGNYLVSLYIKENSDDCVIFCGDVSDEMFASYRGFMSAPDDEALIRSNVEMLKNIRYYDVLRSDKSISGASLEARVPFGDLKFLNFVMSLPAKYKRFNHEHMEKYYLRKAFDGYLPDELLWRRKEAFSDGVSSLKRSWFEIIREYVDSKMSDEEYEESVKEYEYNQPYDKESLFYRRIFDKYYGGNESTIPYYWRHPFSMIKDPSARLLDTY